MPQPQTQLRRKTRCGRLVALLPLLMVTGVQAAEPLSFAAAERRLLETSDLLDAAQAGVRASRDQAEAVQSLWMPVVSLDAQELRYQKTIDIPLQDAKAAQAASIGQFIQGLPGQLPAGTPPALASQIVNQLSQTLPGLVNAIPDSVSFKVQQTLFRPTLSAVMPLYTGGAITAAQDVAKGNVTRAETGLNEARDQLEVRLVGSYFGVQLSRNLLGLAQSNRDGFLHHLDDATRLQQQGVISQAQRLQVQVASNAAQRQYEQARSDYESADAALSSLLQQADSVEPGTPLFVISTPLGPLQGFVETAQSQFPQVQRADADREIARQGLKAAQASYLPSLYLFGESSLDRDHELVVDPDWIVGIGMHYTLFSNTDRRKSESAARERLRAAESAGAQARADIRILTLRAYNEVETSRKAFLSYDTDIVAARENLRVQEISFREGEATAATVIDARNALNAVLTTRAATAYRYDVALAALLSASGEVRQYGDYVQRADREVREP